MGCGGCPGNIYSVAARPAASWLTLCPPLSQQNDDDTLKPPLALGNSHDLMHDDMCMITLGIPFQEAGSFAWHSAGTLCCKL